MALSQSWVLTLAFFSIIGILGYSLTASGAVRYKSVQSAVITILLGGVLTIIAFFITGYGFSFGEDSNKFIGKTLFAGAQFQATEAKNDYDNFVFHTLGAVFVTSIFALGTLERARFFSFSVAVLFLQGLLYPIIVHWTFGKGWLSGFGFIDFGGSTIIHAFGGVAALATSILLHQRRGNNGEVYLHTLPHHQPVFLSLGSLILIFSQIVFLDGLVNTTNAQYVKGLIPVNVLIAAAFGGLASQSSLYIKKNKLSVIAISRGALAGAVAVSASANDIQSWAAALIGVLAGIVYFVAVVQIGRSKVDDPAYALGTHLLPGVVGTILLGLFSRSHGLLYGFGLKQLGIQIVGVLAISAWALLILAILVPLKGFGIFKINPDQEILGIDQSYGGGEAFVFSDQRQEGQSLLSSKRKSIFN